MAGDNDRAVLETLPLERLDGEASSHQPADDNESETSDDEPIDLPMNRSPLHLLDGRDSRPIKSKELTFLNGLAIVVGLQVGSGIFASPAQISRHVSSPGAAVLVWLVAGFLVWTGAASFIELGLAIPRNGGIQEYLQVCYGDYMGCLFSWTWMWISKSSSLAIITSVFADYLVRAAFPSEEPSWLAAKTVGLTGLWLITIVNWSGPKAGAKAANGLFVLKVGMMLWVIFAAMISSLAGNADGVSRSSLGWFGVAPATPVESVFTKIAGYVTAIFGALFGYNGWESFGFIVGDMKHPSRDLPRVLYSALAIVITGFVLVNVSLYLVIPFEEVRGGNSPFMLFANKLFGTTGASIFSIGVALSALGSVNANLFSNGALSVAASSRGYFPAAFANLHCSSWAEEHIMNERLLKRVPDFVKIPLTSFARVTAPYRWEQNVPIYAILAHAFVASLYFLLGTFDGLLTFVGISQYLFLLLSVFGLFILRNRAQNGEVHIPYRTASWNPVMFCICGAFIVVRGILSSIWQGIALALLLVVSWSIFTTRARARSRHNSNGGSMHY